MIMYCSNLEAGGDFFTLLVTVLNFQGWKKPGKPRKNIFIFLVKMNTSCLTLHPRLRRGNRHVALLARHSRRRARRARIFDDRLRHKHLRAADKRLEELEKRHLELDHHRALGVGHLGVIVREERHDFLRSQVVVDESQLLRAKQTNKLAILF